MLKYSAIILTIGGLLLPAGRAYEADRAYMRSLENRIEVLERIGYQEHAEYAAAIYYATGKRYDRP